MTTRAMGPGDIWETLDDPQALTDDLVPQLPLFYEAITCQPHTVPDHERAVILAVRRLAWQRRQSWYFWFRLDSLGTLADSYMGREVPGGDTCTG